MLLLLLVDRRKVRVGQAKEIAPMQSHGCLQLVDGLTQARGADLGYIVFR